MDPFSIGGLAIGVASIGLQVYTGCVQGIQLLVTALDYEKDAKYLNIRLRFEQQRLFAWSETSGLLDIDGKDHEKILNSNCFGLHRQSVLDLLMQIQCLVDDFTKYQQKHNNLRSVQDMENVVENPERDAKQANFPLSTKHRDFIRKSMAKLRGQSQESLLRFKWVSFDKDGFELLLSRFTTLNDKITDLLDHRMQAEIHSTVQNTNCGVLLLHHKVDDLTQLVQALNSQLAAGTLNSAMRMSMQERKASVASLAQLSTLAKFKAFYANIDPSTGTCRPMEEAKARFLEIPTTTTNSERHLCLDGRLVEPLESDFDAEASRCEGFLRAPESKQRVWIEWKDYDGHVFQPGYLSRSQTVERVRKLAALLNHNPKPEAFRTLHCLGYFDKADPSISEDETDLADRRLGLVFERPRDSQYHRSLAPVSLRELLTSTSTPKPRVTSRIALARSLSNCLLYLHVINWLHKGLRSSNILFFRDVNGEVDFTQPYVSGFDFSRPGGSEEMTDVPLDDAAQDLYRHPHAQSSNHVFRKRYKKSFDIYSLGVIFVEIAHWKAIEDILSIDMRRARGNCDDLRQVRVRLLDAARLWNVGTAMGQRFEEATGRCLKGEMALDLEPGDDEAMGEVARKLSGAFYEHVVRVLDGITI